MIWLIISAIIVVIIFVSGIRIVRPTHKGIIETFGKYSRIANNGFNWIIPGIQRLIRINTTERMQQVDPQEIITEDKLNARVDLVIYYKVRTDEDSIKKSVYNVDNFRDQIVVLGQTTARNVIGGMLFKDVNSKRNELNGRLASIMKVESANWGVDIIRVELKEIIPPKDVQDTMNKVIKAENEKRSAIDFATAEETRADGIRRARIKEAEGEKQASILRAQGQRENDILVAEGKSKAFDLVNKSFTGNAQLLRKLEVTENSLKDNSKIILSKDGISPQLIIGDIPLNNKNDQVFKEVKK